MNFDEYKQSIRNCLRGLNENPLQVEKLMVMASCEDDIRYAFVRSWEAMSIALQMSMGY